ncbi:MAG: carboxylesterase family protein [Bacteroidetes bacterium]|nr:MAG: carboxylesterase family protein [Bacteroidota bacterium]RLD95363.1 MAG: carboxylesterase family protein [Bacteroidota bacterium]
MKSRYLYLVLILLLGSCTTKPTLLSELVQLPEGLILGVQDAESGIVSFKGIPFAAPPVGELRWKAPQAVETWEGILDCDAFGPSPVQGKPMPFMFWSEEFLIPAEPISEDCLYLNVWTEAETTEEKLPVIVYIYGGGFRSGGSGCAIYDGASMASKGVVFVSINYRVGLFGFLAHPELTAESENESSGNYGILDMIAALKWVNRNIAQFGGDPGNVTIAGQSAGAFGVNYLTVSPLAKGIFHRAIAESGATFVSSPLGPALNLSAAEELGVVFAKNMGAGSLDDLRALPSDSILLASGGLNSPYVDGYVIPESVMDTYAKGNQNDVPVLIGWNRDDKMLVRPQPSVIFREQILERYGELADDFFAVYPTATEEEAARSQFDMSRDQTFGIQVYTWAKMQTKSGRSGAWVYNFNRELPAYAPETAFGAFHSGEIVYAYDNLHTLDRPWEAIDQQIADQMSAYWVNFANSGNPNGSGLPQWDPYDLQNEQVMLLDTIVGQQTLPDRGKLGFWEQWYDREVE